jgi:hypothetical protein
MLLGDPTSEQVAQRGIDEGIGNAIPAKTRNTMVNFRSLIGMPGIEFRLHGTVLYNSIYRADDHMLVNAHVYGIGAYLAPILQLRQAPGADLFTTYLNSFEAVWATSSALDRPQADAIA